MQTLTVKQPDTTASLHPLIEKRWSPRAFTDEQIPREQLQELLEAARWAASSMNEQPWRYVYAYRGTEGFDQLWSALMAGNQPWAAKASVLLVSLAQTHFLSNGRPNAWAEHDLGMANAQLMLQAASRDLYGHMMGGFHADQVRELLQLEETIKPVCVIALGYRAEAESLEEPFRSRELAPRSRKPVAEFAREL